MRATRNEIAELVEGDPDWWPNFCAAVAERGQEAIRAERDLRGWSWGALWGWIVGDAERYRGYVQALEAHAQMLGMETVGIADGEGEAADKKLRVDTRFRLAGKVDRARWGDQVTHNVVVDDFGEMLRRVSERRLAAIKSQQNPAIEGEAKDVTPIAERVSEDEEI